MTKKISPTLYNSKSEAKNTKIRDPANFLSFLPQLSIESPLKDGIRKFRFFKTPCDPGPEITMPP